MPLGVTALSVTELFGSGLVVLSRKEPLKLRRASPPPGVSTTSEEERLLLPAGENASSCSPDELQPLSLQ